ncbi:MAG TPA: hypothetical protein VLD86_02865 [Ilumatobacteraceae bacterium]|nr:hypothetical protein [Ilumatobacteraceae bacterium]
MVSGTSATVDGMARGDQALGPVDTRRARCDCSGDVILLQLGQRALLQLFAPSELALEAAAADALAATQPVVTAYGFDACSAHLGLQEAWPCRVAIPVDAPAGIPRQAQDLRQHLVAVGVRRQAGGERPGECQRPRMELVVQLDRQLVLGLAGAPTRRNRLENRGDELRMSRRADRWEAASLLERGAVFDPELAAALQPRHRVHFHLHLHLHFHFHFHRLHASLFAYLLPC